MSNIAIVLIKPDAYERNLHGEILRRLEENGLKVVARKIVLLDEEIIREYQPILNEPSEFGEGWKSEAIEALSRCPVEVLVVKGEGALAKTYLLKKQIRSEYCHGPDYRSRVIFNLIHTADDHLELKKNIEVLIPEANNLL